MIQLPISQITKEQRFPQLQNVYAWFVIKNIWQLIKHKKLAKINSKSILHREILRCKEMNFVIIYSFPKPEIIPSSDI